jgi:hypothetical protein
METITLAMMVYCLAFVALIFALGAYRRVKRHREAEAFRTATPEAGRGANLGPSSNAESPSQGAPPIKAA